MLSKKISALQDLQSTTSGHQEKTVTVLQKLKPFDQEEEAQKIQKKKKKLPK
jgi:hypothetical protein